MTGYWEIRVSVADQAEAVAEIIAAACGAEAVSLHREEEGGDWLVSLIAAAEPCEARMARAVEEAGRMAGAGPLTAAVEPVPERDWLEENRRSFPPLGIGSLHIYGSHVETPVPEGMIGLRLDAGRAFGSGTHATTHGCVVMLERCLAGLETAGRPPNIADIGCGSGILAMAAAKLSPGARVLAVDNDPVAVAVAGENAARNGLAGNIACGVSDGYGAALVRDNAPFDLVLANILPSPLVAMAPDAAAHLAADGVLIASGLNGAHVGSVVAGHEAAGLGLCDRFSLDGWETLVFRHNRGRRR